MPKQTCSICTHHQFTAIDTMLKAGESLGKTAKRFGLTKAAVHRHVHHADNKQRRQDAQNPGHIAHIDAEIKKLIQQRDKARSRRDGKGVAAISRELRNWFILRQKAELASIAMAHDTPSGAELPMKDAIAIAKAVIESQLADPEVRTWLEGLLERVRATGTLPEGQS